MNSLERIAASVKFQQVDRVPVIAQVFGHAAAQARAALSDYVQNGEILAECQLAALKRYGYDAVFSVMDVNVETEACGSMIKYSSGSYPTIEGYAISPDSDFSQITVPDPDRSGRMPEMLKALKIMRRELGDTTAVIGCVMGPFTLAAQLIGTENSLYMAIDHPRRLELLMDRATEIIIAFGTAQLKAGAHLPVVFDPAASPAVVPPAFFGEFEAPRLKRIFSALSSAGSMANWLHIAGPVSKILKYYPDAGVTLANFDYCVTPAEASGELPQTCFDGNIKPLMFVEGTPDEIKTEADALLEFFKDRGGFILSSGCEIPLESAPENIAAMVEAARGNGSRS